VARRLIPRLAAILAALALQSCFSDSLSQLGTTQNYGACCADFAAGDKRQPGMEIQVPPGLPVIAATDGTVIDTSSNTRFGGYTVRLSHGAFDTYYTYLGRIDVSRGQLVHRGDKLGLTGFDYKQRSVLQFAICRPDSSCLDIADAEDPAKYWAKGSPQCFDPDRDTPPPQSLLTTPIACKGYANKVMRPERQQKENEGMRPPIYP
jgi:hypothetical protein